MTRRDSQDGLGRLQVLFEQTLQQPAPNRLAYARDLCNEEPELLDSLLKLIERDLALEDEAVQAGSGLHALACAALPEVFPEGRRIGAFRIDGCIGRGGMGAVYRVTRVDGQVEQVAALKLLRPFVDESVLSKKFELERRVLAALEHPNICRFLDAGALPGGQPYVLMELIDGVPLFQYCDDHRLGLVERLQLFLKIVDAVAYSHSKLVIHRDIKSSNVLVTRSGQIKLVDFGIAKFLDDPDWSSTRTVERAFSPRSAAPEQFTTQAVGASCDVYGLGQLLYELLSGLPPFDFSDLSFGTMERMVLEEMPARMSERALAASQEAADARGFRSVRDLARGLRGDLDAIVSRCLRKKPDHRYRSVELLQEEIERVLTRRPIVARSGDRWYRIGRHLSRYRIPISIGAAFATLLIASMVIISTQAIKVADERARAILERDRAQQTVSLLKKAFISADPARVEGGAVTARQILQSARPMLDEFHESQPELFFSLASVIAEVELALGMSDAAAEISGRGLEAISGGKVSAGEQRHLQMLHARALLDSQRRNQGLEVLAAILSDDTEPMADWLLTKGKHHALNGNFESAIEILETSLSQYSGVGPENFDAVSARWWLGLAQSSVGLHEDSVRTYTDALEWISAGLGHEHPHVSLNRIWLVDALRRAGDFKRASEQAAHLVTDVELQYGASSVMSGRSRVSVAMLADSMGDYEAAASEYRQALRSWDRALAPDNPNLMRARINLARVLESVEGGSSDAEALHLRILSDAEAVFGEDSAPATRFRFRFAGFLTRQDRGLEALEVLSKSSNGALLDVVGDEALSGLVTSALLSAGCTEPSSSHSEVNCHLVPDWLQPADQPSQ